MPYSTMTIKLPTTNKLELTHAMRVLKRTNDEQYNTVITKR